MMSTLLRAYRHAGATARLATSASATGRALSSFEAPVLPTAVNSLSDKYQVRSPQPARRAARIPMRDNRLSGNHQYRAERF